MRAYKTRFFIASIFFILMVLAFFKVPHLQNILGLQFTSAFQKTLCDFSFYVCIIFILTILSTLFFGRLYCSLICPLGFLQEIFSLFVKQKNVFKMNLPLKYFIAAATFGALVGGSALIAKHIDPYAAFGSFITFSGFGFVFVAFVLILTFFKNRLFCSNICPVGAFLGILSKIAPFKIYVTDKCTKCKMCGKYCPTGSIKNSQIDNETCIKCLRCLGACRNRAIEYGKIKRKTKFSLKRRQLILAASTIAIFSTVVKTSADLIEKASLKIQNIILPAGAVSTKRMLNKCINCNLCVNNCPNGILAKANEDFGAVHIDYNKGKGYCEFGCNKCSSICPAGAIKTISKKEKQRTRIAMAVIDSDKCVDCGKCTKACPVSAIEKVNKTIVFNGRKCIGCGKCKTVCKRNAIEIYSVNEQKTI